MLEDVICPSCGLRNPGDVEACVSCNFPLQPIGGVAKDRAAEGTGSGPAPAAPVRMRRPQRRGAPLAGQSVWLWLFFGTFAAALLIYVAIDTNRKRNIEQAAPVAGSNPVQQAYADSARAAIAADSTNFEARLALANVLYDTGNWDEAIIHYRAVVRNDSTRVPPIVDLGVCYYNLGATNDAEALFHRALRLEPHQPIALFNLGIVNDRRGEPGVALPYYQRALQYANSDELKATIQAAIARMAQKSAPGAPASK